MHETHPDCVADAQHLGRVEPSAGPCQRHTPVPTRSGQRLRCGGSTGLVRRVHTQAQRSATTCRHKPGTRGSAPLLSQSTDHNRISRLSHCNSSLHCHARTASHRLSICDRERSYSSNDVRPGSRERTLRIWCRLHPVSPLIGAL